MSITAAQAAAGIGRKVVYRAPHVPAVEKGEEGVITSVSRRGVFVRYGSDVGSRLTPFDTLEFVGATGNAVVPNPDSPSHFLCPAAVAGVGPNRTSDDDFTHHIVGGRCRYCGLTATAIRAQEGLP